MTLEIAYIEVKEGAPEDYLRQKVAEIEDNLFPKDVQEKRLPGRFRWLQGLTTQDMPLLGGGTERQAYIDATPAERKEYARKYLRIYRRQIRSLISLVPGEMRTPRTPAGTGNAEDVSAFRQNWGQYERGHMTITDETNYATLIWFGIMHYYAIPLVR